MEKLVKIYEIESLNYTSKFNKLQSAEKTKTKKKIATSLDRS